VVDRTPEMRVIALTQAVNIITKKPSFHGDMSNPAIINFSAKETVDLATYFERYINEGSVPNA